MWALWSVDCNREKPKAERRLLSSLDVRNHAGLVGVERDKWIK